MGTVKNLIHDFSRLFFPHRCVGCGGDVLNKESPLCLRCLHALPLTNFHLYAGNPAEQHFEGVAGLVSAASYCYFTKQAMMQQVLHGLKYRGHIRAGHFLGRMMGRALLDSGRFGGIDALVPVPLHRARERARGYNQSAVLCEGIGQVMELPVITGAVIRRSNTSSQTRKSPVERWQNMREQFYVLRPEELAGRHLLLVDDIITTGSTLTACAQALVQAPEVRLSVATLAYATR